MSYSPFAYSYPSSSQLLMTGQHPSAASNCCESSPTSPTEPHSAVAAHQSAAAAAVCSALPAAAAAAYDSRLLSSYPRLATGLAVNGFYGTSYQDQTSYVTAALGTNPSAFYSSLPTPYMKDSRGAWGSLPQAAACYPYDPSTLAAYGPYGDRYGAIDNAARRKNATRETTNTLKAWLYEHRKNPYPTKGEKIMLAIITKMTLTQVSTWFANARRRLKKENKMTWEPRNKTSDSADGDEKSDNGSGDEDDRPTSLDNDKKRNMSDIKQENDEDDTRDSQFKIGCMDSPENSSSSESRSPSLHCMRGGLRPSSPVCGIPGPGSDRPKIWSLAHTATSDSPPPIRRTSPTLRSNDPYDIVKPEESYGSSELSLRNVMYREDVKPMMGEMNGVHAKTWMNGNHQGNKSYTGVDLGQRCSPQKPAFGPQTFSDRRPSYCDMLGGNRQLGYGVTMDRQPPPPLIRMNYSRDDDMLQSTAKASNAMGTCASDKQDNGALLDRKLYSSPTSPGTSPVPSGSLQASISPSALHGGQTAFKPLPARNSCSEPPAV